MNDEIFETLKTFLTYVPPIEGIGSEVEDVRLVKESYVTRNVESRRTMGTMGYILHEVLANLYDPADGYTFGYTHFTRPSFNDISWYAFW